MKSCLVIFFGLSFSMAVGQPMYRNPDVPMSNVMKSFRLLHIHYGLSEVTQEHTKKAKIGVVEAYPQILSAKFDKEVKSSMSSYEKRDFQTAKAVLEEAVVAERDNPFILHAYAKACYQVDKPKAYEMYKRLIGQVDSVYKNSDTAVVVDLWFRDAYFKLGTLYMENNEWQKATYELSRFLLNIQEAKGNPLYVQGLEYLAECAFNLYDDQQARYLANRILYYNPDDDYAHELLEKMKK